MTRRVAVQFVAEMIRFRRDMRAGADDVRKVKQEAVAAQREVRNLGGAGEKAGRELGDGIVRGLDGRLRNAKGRFVKAGEDSGKSFGDGFERGSRRGLLRVAGILGGGTLRGAADAPWLGLAAVPATAAAASASLQTIPPVLAAIGGGLGAIPGLAAGSAASIGVLKASFGGLGDAIEEAFADERDPYLRLSRNGQRFVTALTAQKQTLLDLRNLAQDQVFAGLDAELTDLSQRLLPFARTQVQRFGSTWNTTFREAAALTRDPELMSAVDVALANVDGLFDRVNTRIAPTGRALGNIFRTSMPVVNAWGDGLLEYVDQFDGWIDRAAASGELEEFFEDAAAQADALLDIGRELFTLIGRIGGMQQGSTLLRDMADALERFNDEAHNMRSVEGVIRTGNAAIEGVVDVLVVLGETLGETLADPGTAQAVALFFDVLKAGAQIVGGLAQVFAMLPDPMQAVLLAGAGLAIVGGRLFSVFGKANTALGGFTDRLRDAGPAGQRTARGLESTTKWAGRAAGAFVALQAASIVFASFRGASADVDRLTRSLQAYAARGEVSGEITRLFGGDLENLGRDVQAAGDGWFPKLGRAIEGIIPGARELNELMHGGSWTGSAENVAALDQALARLVETSGKQASFEAWNRILSESGMNADELIKLLPAYEQALKDADVSTGSVAAKQELLNGTMQSAITTMGSYTRAWQVLNGAHLSADEAALAAKDAIDQVTATFKSNKDVVEGNSRAALENRIAVGQAAQAAADAAQKKYEETGSVAEASKVYDGYIGALRKTLDQTALTDEQIDLLLATYAQMPPVKQTEVSAPGAADATRQAAEFNTALKRLPNGKFVRVTVGGVESAIDRVNRLQAEVNALTGKNIRIGVTGGRGGFLEQRWGGYHDRDGWTKAAVGLLREATIYSARYPGRYMIAEPETGGEAFIPLRGNKERSVMVARRAMDPYGMDVVPRSVISGQPQVAMAASPTVQVNAGDTHITVEIDGEQFEARITSVVRERDRQLKRRVGAGAGR